MKIKMAAKLVSKFVVDNLPTILSITAGVGLIGSVVTAIIDTPNGQEKLTEAKIDKAEKIEREAQSESELDIYRNENGELDLNKIKLTPWEYVKILTPVYWKTGVLMIGTGVCIFTSNHVSKKRLGLALAALSLKEKQIKECEAKIKEFFGKKKAQEFQHELNKDRVMDISNDDEVVNTGHGNELFYEPIMDKLFRSSTNSVKDGWNTLVNQVLRTGEVSLTDLYYYWDIPIRDTWYSDQVRWIYEPDSIKYADPPTLGQFGFSTYDRTGEHIAMISYSRRPDVG